MINPKSVIIIVLVITLSLFYAFDGVTAAAEIQDISLTYINSSNVQIYLNGEKAPLNYVAYVDTTNKSVISLNDCRLIFEAQIEVSDSKIIIRKGAHELILNEGDYWHMPITVLLENKYSANLQLDEFYLPLRTVAEGLEYKVDYNSWVRSVIIRSTDYEGPDPQLPAPPQLPANMPKWGTLNDIPVLTGLWPTEDIIGGYFTGLANSPPPRTHNILLSCSKLNGVIVKPGEVFSFNRTVGRRTAAAGYKNAIVFDGGRMVQGIGGGVCQTSSTLYNGLLVSQLKIVERHPHSLRVTYVPTNRDATISWDGADLKFRNNKPYPVKILCEVYNNYVVFAIAATE